MITYTSGNLLDDDAKVLVNPVNCMGVMAGGLARQFEERWPEILAPYAEDCASGRLRLGACTVNVTNDGRTVVQFPTMELPGSVARLGDIAAGLECLRELIQADPEAFSSIAVPALGCGVGGLDWDDVRPLIESALGDLEEADVRVYEPRG